jgi:CRISPR/Cas system-associated exonuclease Cas4 (RecB family)
MENKLLFGWNKLVPDWEVPKLIPNENNEGRYYSLVDGTVLPSITTILKTKVSPGLVQWRARLGEAEAQKVMRRAANRGKVFHSLAETYLTTSDPVKTLSGAMPDMIEQFRAIKPVLQKISNIRAIELPVYSRILKVAGTIDCVGDYEGVPSIIDFKTSSIQKERSYIDNYIIQTTAYSLMLNELSGLKYRQLAIIIATFDETNKPQVFIEQVDRQKVADVFQLIKKYQETKDG